MSALGGSGRAAPKEEVRVSGAKASPERTLDSFKHEAASDGFLIGA